jgi:hypothetical protein
MIAVLTNWGAQLETTCDGTIKEVEYLAQAAGIRWVGRKRVFQILILSPDAEARS